MFVYLSNCETSIYFFNLLLFLLRKVHREREQAFEMSMKLYQDASPGDVGVPMKLFPKEPEALQGSYPYESAVQELKLLITDYCPQRKLECIGESKSVDLIKFAQELTGQMASLGVNLVISRCASSLMFLVYSR